MLRRRQEPEPAAPAPEWKRRFDAAVEMIHSQPQPAWLDDRLDALRRSLDQTSSAQDRLDASLAQLDVDQTGSDLKTALRERQRPRPGADTASMDRRIDALRQRYDAVHDMANHRETLARQLIDTVTDVELLAVQAIRNSTVTDERGDHLADHLERLDTGLRPLELARREIDAL